MSTYHQYLTALITNNTQNALTGSVTPSTNVPNITYQTLGSATLQGDTFTIAPYSQGGVTLNNYTGAGTLSIPSREFSSRRFFNPDGPADFLITVGPGRFMDQNACYEVRDPSKSSGFNWWWLVLIIVIVLILWWVLT